MADLTELESSQSVKVVGSEQNATETNYTSVTDNNETKTHDVFDNGWLTSTISISSGATAELKVGGSVLTGRKGVFMQALDKNIKWGHSSGTTPFNAFKNQFFSLPIGDGTTIFLKNEGGSSADISIGELA